MAKALIINWMNGEHLQFDTYEEAELHYEEIINEYKKENAEIDFSLYILKKELNNID